MFGILVWAWASALGANCTLWHTQQALPCLSRVSESAGSLFLTCLAWSVVSDLYWKIMSFKLIDTVRSSLYRQDHSLSPANQQVDISVWNQNIMNSMSSFLHREEGEPIISGPDPMTYWQEICTVPIALTKNLSRFSCRILHCFMEW